MEIKKISRGLQPVLLAFAVVVAVMDADDDVPPLAIRVREETIQPISSETASVETPVGVTVITGYLGAGKSTVRFPPNRRKSMVPAVFLLIFVGKLGLCTSFLPFI